MKTNFYLLVIWSISGELQQNKIVDVNLTNPSYAPLTILLASNLMHRTNSSWPSRTRKHAPHSTSQSLKKKHKLLKLHRLTDLKKFQPNK